MQISDSEDDADSTNLPAQITLHQTRAIYFLRKLSVVEQDLKAEVTHKAREQLTKKKEMYAKRIDEKLQKILEMQHKLS